jgi:16S rRNA A1518/A1519 N6-dimethyltransferase RsmA/KsgA/DIM1 with predicted DNA glycosylase/AP lyase activity
VGLAAERILPFARLLFQQRRKALRSTVPKAVRELGGDPERVKARMDDLELTGDERIDGVAPEVVVTLARAVLEELS